MSWIQVRDELDLYEYYILLSEALEANEAEDFNRAYSVYVGFNNPKQLRRMQKDLKHNRSAPQSTNPFEAIVNFVAAQAGSNFKPSSDPLMFARHTGRPVAFIDENGLFSDEDGNQIERTPDHFVVPLHHYKDKIH